MNSESYSARRRRRTFLGLTLALSLALNLLGIWWGQYHPDDLTHQALYMLGHGTLRPYHFVTPTLYTYALLLLTVIPSRLFEILGLLSSGHGLRDSLALLDIPIYYRTTARDYLGPRILTACAATFGVYLLYRLGKTCFNARTGLLAAIQLSVCMGYVAYAHVATPEVPAVVMIILAMWACIRADGKPTGANYALAGLTAGLAASTKYYGITMLFPLLFLCWRGWRRRVLRSKTVLLTLFLVPAGFLAGTPYALFSFFSFAKDVVQIGAFAPIFSGTGYPLGYSAHLKNLAAILGIPLFFVTAAGLAWSVFAMLRFKERGFIYLWAFILPFFLVIGRSHFNPLRYILPVVPFAVLIGARALDSLLNAVRRPARYGIIGVFSAVLAYSSLYCLASDFHIILDSRRMFLMWARNHMPEGSSVELTRYCPIPPGDHLLLLHPFVAGRDELYGAMAENRLYRLALRHGIILRHYLKRGGRLPEPAVERALAWHLGKEEDFISVNADEKFDYSLDGLHERGPDYLVVSNGYANRFIGRGEKYPALHAFFSAFADDADKEYRRVAVFPPPSFTIVRPPLPFSGDTINVYARKVGPVR